MNDKAIYLDLTKPQDARTTSALARIAAVPSARMIAPTSPFESLHLVYDLLKEIFRQGKVEGTDAEMIERIIQAGADSDVDEMTIKLNKEQGVGFDFKEVKASRKFKVNVGTSGETSIDLNVKYQ